MSRDGLPRVFSRVHQKYRTPDFSTWVAGFVVGIPAGLLDIGTLADLSNIGTLFAFALVAGGVLILRYREPDRHRPFRAPGGLLAPIVAITAYLLLMAGLPITNWLRFFGWLVIGLVILLLLWAAQEHARGGKRAGAGGGSQMRRDAYAGNSTGDHSDWSARERQVANVVRLGTERATADRQQRHRHAARMK